MSNLELREFHSFLEGLIERASREQRFSIERIVQLGSNCYQTSS